MSILSAPRSSGTRSKTRKRSGTAPSASSAGITSFAPSRQAAHGAPSSGAAGIGSIGGSGGTSTTNGPSSSGIESSNPFGTVNGSMDFGLFASKGTGGTLATVSETTGISASNAGAQPSSGTAFLDDLFGDLASSSNSNNVQTRPSSASAFNASSAQGKAYTTKLPQTAEESNNPFADFDAGGWAGFDDSSSTGGASKQKSPTRGQSASVIQGPSSGSRARSRSRKRGSKRDSKIGTLDVAAFGGTGGGGGKPSSPKPSYPPPDKPVFTSNDSDLRSPRMHAPRPPSVEPPSKRASKSGSKKKMKSIDVLPLLHKGVKMNKFKMRGAKSKVRLFYLSQDNLYFCWSPNLDQGNPNGFTFSGLVKSSEERSILLEAVKSIQRNPPSAVEHLRFIPKERRGHTLTIMYNANAKPSNQTNSSSSKKVKKGRGRAGTFGIGFKPPQYKQVNVMAYEPFHFEMVACALETLVARAKQPDSDISQTFEMYVDFEKEILPKHLRPQKFKWEALGAPKSSGDEDEKKDS